jgi:hypothetical protein
MANGTADIPAGASLSIGGVACDAGVTAANVNTLVDGSNADSLHTHDSVESVSGLTTTGLADGDFGYISSANTVLKTSSAAIGTALVMGVNEGTVSSMTTRHGSVIENAKFTTDGGSPSDGARCWLANAADDTSTGAGKLTATVPTTGVEAEAGLVLSNGNYVGSKTCKILFLPREPIEL